MSHRHPCPFQARPAFTLVELLVVIAVVGLLIGLAVPALSAARRAGIRTGCGSNLAQIGKVMSMYLYDHGDAFPRARHMPEPFFSIDPDPPLPRTLRPYLAAQWPDAGPEQQVYRCPGDSGYVYARARMSYQYEPSLSDFPIDQYFPVLHKLATPDQVWVLRDFDGGELELFPIAPGGERPVVEAPFFHEVRNFLFADFHVGRFTLKNGGA